MQLPGCSTTLGAIDKSLDERYRVGYTGLLMELTRVDALVRSPWSLLIYGYPKVGKTVYACGAPDPLLLSVDPDGEISLRNHPELAHVYVEQTRTFDSVIKVLKQIAKDKPTEIKTIIIDTISTLQNDQRIDMVSEEDILRSNSMVFNQSIYAVNNMKLNVLMRLLIKLKANYNIILLSHLKEDIVGGQGNTKVMARPALSDAIRQVVMAVVNGIYVMESSADKRRLLTQGNALIIASGRYKIPKPYLGSEFDELRKYLEA